MAGIGRRLHRRRRKQRERNKETDAARRSSACISPSRYTERQRHWNRCLNRSERAEKKKNKRITRSQNAAQQTRRTAIRGKKNDTRRLARQRLHDNGNNHTRDARIIMYTIRIC